MKNQKAVISYGWTISCDDVNVLIDILNDENGIAWDNFYLYDFFHDSKGDPYKIMEKDEQKMIIVLK